MSATADASTPVGGILPRPFQRLKAAKRREIIDGLVARGRTKDQAEAIVNEIGDGTLLEMLIKLIGNISKLIDLIDDLFA